MIWFIGLSGSGKTTLGSKVFELVKGQYSNTVLIDGDEIRSVFGQNSDDMHYTLADRRLNAERITSLCQLLDRQGINVICCVLSIFQDQRLENRRKFSRYFEVLMDAPLKVLKARDVKGLYTAATQGQIKNVVGIDLPYYRPTTSDMVIDTSVANPDINEIANQVLEAAGMDSFV